MAKVESAPVEAKKEEAPAPALPDFLLSPNAVFKDEGVQWRYGRAPDYSKTRKVWEEGRQTPPFPLRHSSARGDTRRQMMFEGAS